MFGIPFPYQIAAVVFVVAAAFGAGYIKGVARAEVEIQRAATEAQQKIAELQAKQAETNVQVVTKYVDRVRTITVQNDRNAEFIATLPSTDIKLTYGWVYLHDLATKGGDAEPSAATNGTPTTFTSADALRAVTDNYSVCRQNSEQLIQLQDWIRSTQANVDTVNE